MTIPRHALTIPIVESGAVRMPLEVIKVDFVDRFVETRDRRMFPIVHLFDDQGRETGDHRAAVLCIAGAEGRWLSVRLKQFSRSSLQ